MSTDAQEGVESAQKLTPEQKEAIEVFVATLPRWRTFYVPQLPNTIFENNARFFTPISLKKDHFPREAHWTWNRSNGTIVIDLYNQFRIKLTKYNSRRRKNSKQKQPSYKIWNYAVTVLQTNEKFAFIWCTKGRTRASRSMPSPSESKDIKQEGDTPAPQAPPIQFHPSQEQCRTYPTNTPEFPKQNYPSVQETNHMTQSAPNLGMNGYSSSVPPRPTPPPQEFTPTPTPSCNEYPYVSYPNRPPPPVWTHYTPTEMDPNGVFLETEHQQEPTHFGSFSHGHLSHSFNGGFGGEFNSDGNFASVSTRGPYGWL